MFSIKPPYFGAAYYPEAWDESEIDKDIAMMKKAGMNVMRIGEFAWSTMEPAENQYDFRLMHIVIDKLKAAGIATIMCTPTCTPPAWLAVKYPEIFMQNDIGHRAAHGGRRAVCVNNPKFIELSKKIVTRMAQEFANEESIIGWQIDNELAYNCVSFIGCCCESCLANFKRAMKEKYHTIEALNDAWDNHVWSIEYFDFDQLQAPTQGVWQHPSYNSEYNTEQANSISRYCTMQSDILHEYVKVPVGTDMMPILFMSYEDMNKSLDVVQFNHYNSSDNLWEVAFWCDYLRNLKNKPFWITETSTCWGGGIAMSHLTEQNFCTANTWLPMTLGAEATLYWLWRVHYGGHELMHGSVVDSWCRPIQTFNEVQALAENFGKASDMICNTKVRKSKMAIVFSFFAEKLFTFQPMVNGFNYVPNIQNLFYRPLERAQMRPDVISTANELDDYELIMTPFLPCLEENGFNEKIFDFVRKGGVWIVGPIADTRTLSYAKYLKAPRGFLEDETDVRWTFHIPNGKEYDLVSETDGKLLKTNSVIYEAYEVKGDSKVLARHKGGFADGYAAITETKYGKGKIITVGASLKEDELVELVKSVSSIKPLCKASPNLVCSIHEADGEEKYICAVEAEDKEATLQIPFDCIDILTDEKYNKDDDISISHHDVKILKKK